MQEVVVSQLSLPVRLMAAVRAMGPVGDRWMDELLCLLASLETEWKRLGVTRQSIIKVWIAERLGHQNPVAA